MNLKRCFAIALCGAALTMQSFAQAQMSPEKMAQAGKPIAPAESLSALLDQTGKEIIDAADAMPADKYDFVPTGSGDFKGVRSFAYQVKHLAAANYHFFQDWDLPGKQDPKKIMELKSKDEIMKALRDSYVFAHAAANSITPENAFLSVAGPAEFKGTRTSLLAYSMVHSMDHYGQMVEYLRMNSIIPPASRK